MKRPVLWSFGAQTALAEAEVEYKDKQSPAVYVKFPIVTGEARSHETKFVKEIVKAYREAFAAAAALVVDDRGKKARVEFMSRADYFPFKLKDTEPVIRHTQAAAVAAGFTPTLRTSNGGLDANWLVKHGIPTVTFGAGQNAIHTVEEWVDLDLFLEGCKMALALATRG